MYMYRYIYNDQEEIGRKWSEKIRAAKEEGRRRKEAQDPLLEG